VVTILCIKTSPLFFKTAFSSSGRKAHVDGHYFKCWYYNPSYVIKCLKNDFDLLSIEGLCTLVPPSYIENFAEKYPNAYQFLKAKKIPGKKNGHGNMLGIIKLFRCRKNRAIL